jgi:hypothetical protein
MGVYLEDHPPASRQFHDPRRARVTGAIVVHTAEAPADLLAPDLAAEGVAGFIARRSDPGSYHTLVDSDSIVRLGRYEWEMFGEGTGGNRWALHLSFACETITWRLGTSNRWVTGALRNGARAAADMARWVESTTDIVVPARRITPAQYRAGRPGFIGHGELDPGRRSDPGLHFPWEEFLAHYADEMSTTTEGDDMPPPITYDRAMAQLDELWLAYRGTRPPEGDRRAWGRDLAEKILNRGEDPQPTLAYIEWILREQHAKAKA